jgi:hypothetical protein
LNGDKQRSHSNAHDTKAVVENSPQISKNNFELSLGVSICLDVVSIESLNLDIVKQFVSTVEKMSTFSKRLSRSRSRNSSRPGNFIISRQFVSISMEKWVDFCIFLVEISQFVETFHHFHTQNVSIMSRFLDKSRSQFVSTVETPRLILNI